MRRLLGRLVSVGVKTTDEVNCRRGGGIQLEMVWGRGILKGEGSGGQGLSHLRGGDGVGGKRWEWEVPQRDQPVEPLQGAGPERGG